MFNPPAQPPVSTRTPAQRTRVLRAGCAIALLATLFGISPTHASAPAIPLVLAPRVLAPAVSPSTCNAEITGDNTTDFASADASAVRNAVAAVATGGTVKVAGTCTGAVTQGGSTQVVLITKTLTLSGGYTVTNWTVSNPISNPVALSASLGGRVISATQPLTVANLALLFGFSAGPGAGIFAQSALVLINTDLQLNNASSGNGGGVYAAGPTTIQGGFFFFNSSSGSGGGLYANSTLAITGTQFLYNASNNGGGAYANGAATLNGGRFENNQSTSSFGSGGGLYAGSTLALTGTQFISNTATFGGGVYAGSTATLNGGRFENNLSSGTGGGLYAVSTMAMAGTEFISNTAQFGGGVFAASTATLNGGRFENNQSSGSGGGLYANSTLAMAGTQFISNTANDSGGGAYANGAATLNGGRFENNQSTSSFGSGGGLYVGSTLAITGTQFLYNVSYSGGGAYANGAATLNGGLFQNNSSSGGGGGGLYAGNTLALTATTFSSNAAFGAGGVFAVGAATLNGGLFQNNRSFGSSGGGGGGLYAGNTLALTATQFIGNSAVINGGGVAVYGAATFNGGRFENNSSVRVGGGGVYAGSTLALTGTQFISNTANDNGGGLYLIASPSRSRIVNSLFARNRAGTGDAMYLLDSFRTGGTVDVIHTTVASPTLSVGAAIVVVTGTLNLTNTLIASHTVGISQTGSAIVNENYTLFAGNTTDKLGSINSGGNSVSGSAGFVDAANDNYRLTVTSSANDVATNAGVATDLDGSPRLTFGGFDIGAYEFQGPNNAPVANAGTLQTVAVESGVTLNGSSSFDPENHAITFGWTQIGGASMLLSNSTTASPFFTAPPAAGTLIFQLVVTDAYGLPSAPSTVNITVFNNAPTAEAGPAQTVQTSMPVALDGLGSFDPEDQALTFAWTQVSGPVATLSSNTAAEPTFAAPASTSTATLVFQLVVTDAGGLSSAPSTVNITVTPAQVMIPLVVRE